MKKLKVALIAAFCLCFSMFLFACGSKATLKSIEAVSNATLYDVGAGSTVTLSESDLGLVVTATYSDGTTAEVTDYTISEGLKDLQDAYASGTNGTYTIVIQYTEGDLTRGAEVDITISHEFGTADSSGTQTCSHCGATKTSQTISDSVYFPAWTSTDALDASNLSYGSVVSDRWVSYGSIGMGQTYTISGTIKPDSYSTSYYTPMIAIQANGTGLAVRADSWVLHDNPGGQTLYAWSIDGVSENYTPTSGTASADDDDDWDVYISGTLVSASYLEANAWFEYSASYGTDGIMTLTYSVTGATAVYTFKVPSNIYDVLVFGECCEMNVTSISITKEVEMTKLEITSDPTKVVYADNTYIDRTGLVAEATYSNGSVDAVSAYAIYGEKADGTSVLLDNGGTSVAYVTDDMEKFYIAYGSEKIYLDEGYTSTGTGASKISVVKSPIYGATENYVFTSDFYSDDITLSYDIDSSKTTPEVSLSGRVGLLSDAQVTTVGSGYKYFVAFHLLTVSGDAISAVATAITDATGMKAYVCEASGGGVDIVLLFTEDIDFTVTKKASLVVTSATSGDVTLSINLEGLIVSTVSSFVSSNAAYIDEGGAVVVKYDGIASETAAANYNYFIGSLPVSWSKLSEGGKSGSINYSAEVKDGALYVSYTLPAYSSTISWRVGVYDSSTSVASPLADETITYNFKMSDNAASNGYYLVEKTATTATYLSVSGSTLTVYVLEASTNISGDISFSLNLNSKTAIPYDMSFTATDSAIEFTSYNTLTKNATGTVLVNGTIGDSSDRDVGAVYTIALNVEAAAGVTETDGYYVEYVFDGGVTNKTYYVLSVSSASVSLLTLNVNDTAYTLQTVAGTCVDDEYTYYVYNTSFGFGYTVTVAASDAHEWGEYDTNGVVTCSVCGSTMAKYENDDGSYAVVTVVGSSAVYVKNGDAKNTTVSAIEGALSKGISVTFVANGLTSDWSDQLIKTASNYIITTPNLDPWNNTSSDGYLKELNAYPLTEDLQNDGAWNSFLSTGAAGTNDIVITVSISVDTGIKFYGDGVLLIWYKADRAMGSYTIADFCTRVLTEIQSSGFTFAGSLAADTSTVSNLIVGLGDATKVSIGTYNISGASDYEFHFAVADVDDVSNTDTDGEKWWTAIGASTVKGDFAVQYTWSNTRDTNYTDVVAELYDASSNYWDATILDQSDGALTTGWGTLGGESTTATVTVSATLNGTTVYDSTASNNDSTKLPTALGGSDGFYGGDYKMTIARVGSTLYVIVELTNDDGDVYVVTYTTTNFTTADLTVQLNGNPYWIDDVTYNVGAIHTFGTTSTESAS